MDNGKHATAVGKPPIIPSTRSGAPMETITETTAQPPQLGGLFAGGMPTLRKTNKEAPKPVESHRKEADRNVIPQTTGPSNPSRIP